MKHLAAEAKESIIKKALTRNGQTLDEIALESGISLSTLNNWLRQKRAGLPLQSVRQGRSPAGDVQIARLNHLLATTNLDEAAIGAYCREHGIYSFQLKQWRDDLMKIDNGKKNVPQNGDELKALRAENKRLKQDLRRKEKALAESSALLILKKKADLIWGDLGDD